MSADDPREFVTLEVEAEPEEIAAVKAVFESVGLDTPVRAGILRHSAGELPWHITWIVGLKALLGAFALGGMGELGKRAAGAGITSFGNEAAFAALAGAAPLPASSGRHQRHRLNRGGDRTLNAALHTIVTTRRRMKHPATSAYIARRTAEGLTPKEILRCLKRYRTPTLPTHANHNAYNHLTSDTHRLLSYREPRVLSTSDHRSPATCPVTMKKAHSLNRTNIDR